MKKILPFVKNVLWLIPLVCIADCFTKNNISFNPGVGGETRYSETFLTHEETPTQHIDSKTYLLGKWTFDNSADLGRNSVNNKLNAKINKKAKAVSGVFGNALELSEKNETAISVATDILPAGLEELTFSAWVAPKSFGPNHATVFRKEDVGTAGENRLLFAFQDYGKFLSLGINCGGNYAECKAIVSQKELCDNKWHFIAGTFDGHKMHVYLDGREIGTFERHAKLSTTHDFSPIRIWRDNVAHAEYKSFEEIAVNEPLFIGSTIGKRDFFDGKIDEVCFYSKALDSHQIATIYAEGKQPVSEVGQKAKNTAKTLYNKAESFIETLAATDKNIGNTKVDELDAVELQRLLRNDYPEETNAYVMKWQKNPVNNILLDREDRIKRSKDMETAAFEYLPLTEMQWSVLSPSDYSKWDKVRQMQTQLAAGNVDNNTLGKMLYEMENLINDRPLLNEMVAKYVKPETPKTVDRTAEEARKILENEWLFQCNNKPTIKQIQSEITWARKLAARLDLEADVLKPYLAQLDELELKTKGKDIESEDKNLYFSVRTVKREITFKNPVIDFETILYIDNPMTSGSEANHETRHRLGYQAVPGGRLMLLNGLNPGGKMTKLVPQEPLHGSFWRPDLSYDGNRVLFSFKPHNEKTFHIYEIGIDGKGLRQLSSGIFDDFDPIYMPDDKNIMFLTTRGHIYVRCMPPTNAFVMAKMPLNTKPGDKNLYILSRSGEPEYTPSVMDDGRVIYTRWEYTDKPLWRAQSLWTMHQNGTMVQAFWGNQSVWPDLLKDARQIPGTDRVMFTGSAHHNWYSGSIGIITPSQGFNFPDGLTKVTQEVEWPECGKAPLDPTESSDYHTAGKYTAYYSPYPLSEKEFLVSAERNGKFVLLLMDTDGNREVINEGEYNIWDAMPVRKRKTPIVYPDNVEWPTWEERNNPKPGILYSNNVYDGAPQELKNKAKYLRIWSIDHKTYSYWFKRNYISTGPEISAVQSEGIKKIIGTVPIESDGSVNFVAPSGIALHFQLLDENQKALQTMRSFTGVQPGESRGCLGCHESHTQTQRITAIGKALKSKPAEITPVPWKDISVGYERYVQPVLNNYCAKCHENPKSSAYTKFNSTLRTGFLGFKEPYMTLIGSPTWGQAYVKRNNTGGGFGWADIIMVEAYEQRDSAAYITPKPMTKLSYKSRLVELMSNGKHHGVKVDNESLLRVILWVDAMAPYYGFEELQKMEDPVFQGKDWLSQRPRVQTAPIVPRPGPFDPFYTDEAYDTPAPECRNNLPFGVSRNN